MRLLAKNKQKMYFANQDKIVPIYEIYTDDDGNEYKLDTGDTKIVYGNPIEFFGNISMSGGESEAVEYGVDISSYSAVLVLPKNYLDISETSLIWHNTKPVYDKDGNVDEHSADYSISKVSPSLNVDKYLLKKVVK